MTSVVWVYPSYTKRSCESEVRLPSWGDLQYQRSDGHMHYPTTTRSLCQPPSDGLLRPCLVDVNLSNKDDLNLDVEYGR
jgi:hypothetical protein